MYKMRMIEIERRRETKRIRSRKKARHQKNYFQEFNEVTLNVVLESERLYIDVNKA